MAKQPKRVARSGFKVTSVTGQKLTLLANAPTTPVTVKKTEQGEALIGAKLNGHTLQFANGVAHAIVGKGQNNSLTWVVVGPPSSAYTIAIVEPPGSGCSDAGELDDSGKDAGSCDFNT